MTGDEDILWYCGSCEIAVPDDGNGSRRSCPECPTYMSVRPNGDVPEGTEVREE